MLFIVVYVSLPEGIYITFFNSYVSLPEGISMISPILVDSIEWSRSLSMGNGGWPSKLTDSSNHQCNAPRCEYTSKLVLLIKIHAGNIINKCLTFLSDKSPKYFLIAWHQLSSTSYEMMIYQEWNHLLPLGTSGDGHPLNPSDFRGWLVRELHRGMVSGTHNWGWFMKLILPPQPS